LDSKSLNRFSENKHQLTYGKHQKGAIMIQQQNRQKNSAATAIFLLTAAAVAVNVFFTALKIINLSNLTYHYSFKPQQISIVIFSPLTDQIIWAATLTIGSLIVLLTNLHKKTVKIALLTCLPIFGLLLVFQTYLPITNVYGILLSLLSVYLFIRYSQNFFVNKQFSVIAVLVCLTCIVLCLEAASLLTWTWNLFVFRSPFVQLAHWRFAVIDLQLFSVFYSGLSWLFLAFLTCWLWLPCLKFLIPKINAKFEIMTTKTLHVNLSRPSQINGKVLALGLFATVALAAFVVYYPTAHFSTSILLGTDSTYYFNWINELGLKGPLAALEMDRPFSNLLLYSVQAFTAASTETIVRAAPIFCSAISCLVVFWFVNVGTKDKRLALMSALFTVFSFQTTVSLFVYSLSNWIALIEMFLIFGLFLKNSERHLVKSTVSLSFLGIILLLTHPYTWEVAIAILSTYVAYALLRRRTEDKQKIKQLTAFLSVNIAFFLSYSLLPFGSGLFKAGGAVLNHALPTIVLPNLLNLQLGFENMVKVWVGGLFANPLLIIIAIVGVFAVMDYSKRYNRLMLAWIAVPFAALLMFSPESFFYYRIVYLIPIQIFAASGLCLALDKLEAATKLKSEKSFQMLKVLIVLLVVAFMFNYSLRVSDVIPLHILSG